MENQARILKYQAGRGLLSLVKFWIGPLLVMIFFFCLNYFGGENFSAGITMVGPGLSIVGANLLYLSIYAIVLSFESYYKVFPRLLGFSISRRSYFTSTLCQSALIAFGIALIQGLLFKLDPWLVTAAKRRPLYEFYVFNSRTDSVFFIMLYVLVLFFTILSIARLIAALSYRFGFIFWLTGAAVIILMMSISAWTRRAVWKAFSFLFLDLLLTRPHGRSLLYILLIILAFQALTYVVTLHTNVKERV